MSKKHFSRLLSMLLAVAVMFGILAVPASAASLKDSGSVTIQQAGYSFYAVITAVVNVVKFRKHGSPILSAAKAISLVAAMVSILSLETAMLAQFGDKDDLFFRKAMTGAVGGGVCVIVLGMAVYMIVKSTKEIKRLALDNH